MPTAQATTVTAATTAAVTISARDFIAKWAAGSAAHGLTERAGAQAHFIDLCRVLGVAEPGDPARYCFERGVTRTGTGSGRTDGFADVWLQGHFAWEYKAPGRSLEAALKQLMQYALPLDNPPLLVVSDRQRIEVHSHFTGMPSECHVFLLEDMGQPEVQQRLRALWLAPESFKPRRSNRDITEEAARTFADTAKRLRDAGVPAEQVSHFLTQCVFCFFAEDVGLLPDKLFERLVGVNVNAERLRTQLTALFSTMQGGGLFGVEDIAWFNGGLFKTVAVPPLATGDVAALKAASALNWSAIDPSIFGTLFERGLDPAVRSQLGANYTDPATILRVVEPVIGRPLRAEWALMVPGIQLALTRSKRHGDKAYHDAQSLFVGFLERLRNFRVLDPACGSGNFLYLALKCLKDIEHQVNLEAEALGPQRQHDVTGPHNVLGIELNEYAAELARVTVWIGELQWRIQRGYGFKLNPVLEPLDHIQCRDAVLGADGSEAAWPPADVVVGNPPFVGVGRKRRELGNAYVDRLDAAYAPRVPGACDFVCYWFDKAQRAIAAGRLDRAGLVATNSIRGGANRTVLERINEAGRIFEAWSDQPWVNHGAAVRVSIICFDGDGAAAERCLDGQPVPAIYADLTAPAHAGDLLDVSKAMTLMENQGASFQGASKKAKFEIDAALAREWLRLPNPHGRPNSDVLKPWANGFELSRGPQHQWIIDFGNELSESEAALFETPFAYVVEHVKPQRVTKSEPALRDFWWRFGRPRVELRRALKPLPRFIATVAHGKHRLFTWLPVATSPDQALITVARADDTSLGILHSWLHELWSLRLGTSLEDRPRYTPTTCFETFPFPAGLTPADTAHQRTEALPGGALIPAGLPAAVRAAAGPIAHAAHRLVALRDAWLNPPEWTERLPEVVPLGLAGSPYPDRIVAKPGHEAELAQRTLTKLYNARPSWLAQAHNTLDAAVAAAYGWPDYAPEMPDDEVLRRLLALNLARKG